MSIDIASLYNLIKANGIPVLSIDNPDDDPAHVFAIYDQSASQAQITAGNALISANANKTSYGFVDCTAAGIYPFLFISTAKGFFLPLGMQIGLSKVSGITTPPTVSIGTNSPNYDNIIAAVVSPLVALADLRNILVGTSANTKAILADTWIYLNVRVAAVATQYTVAVRELGQYIPR